MRASATNRALRWPTPTPAKVTAEWRSSLCLLRTRAVHSVGTVDHAMLDELTREVARTAGLAPEQAALAVAAVLRFFTARLPSALVGELHERLGTRAITSAPPPGE